MWESWVNLLMPHALKIYPKYNKLPNLITLFVMKMFAIYIERKKLGI